MATHSQPGLRWLLVLAGACSRQPLGSEPVQGSCLSLVPLPSHWVGMVSEDQESGSGWGVEEAGDWLALSSSSFTRN